MKRLLSLAVCTALTGLVGTAQSQDTNFTGPAVGVSLSAARNKVKYGGFLNGTESKKNAAVGRLDASYSFRLSPQWVLSVGATYDLNKSDFGRFTYEQNGTQSVDIKLKNHVAIYVAPGYQIAPNWLVYGKLSSHYAKGEYNDRGRPDTQDHIGAGIGLGVATAFTKEIEGRFEVEQVNYNGVCEGCSTADGQPKTTQATFYLGYRF